VFSFLFFSLFFFAVDLFKKSITAIVAEEAMSKVRFDEYDYPYSRAYLVLRTIFDEEHGLNQNKTVGKEKTKAKGAGADDDDDDDELDDESHLLEKEVALGVSSSYFLLLF